jgi:hypothetical protein
MTAVTTRLLRRGGRSPIPGGRDEPDVYGHVVRYGWRVNWDITAGRNGPLVTAGRTWTRQGAWTRAFQIAHGTDMPYWLAEVEV